MNVTRSALSVFIAKVLRAGIVFVAVTLFSRRLGAEAVGVYFLFEASLGLLGIVADLGVKGAIEKRISEREAADRVLGSGIVLKAIPLTLVVALVLVFDGALNRYFGEQIAILLVVALLLKEAGDLTEHVLRGEQRVEQTALLSVVRDLSWCLTSWLLVSAGYGSRGLVYGALIGFGLRATLGARLKRTAVGRPKRRNAASIFEYSRYNFISHIGGYTYNWMDVAIIGLFLTHTAVGSYEVAWRVTLLVTLVSGAVGTTLFPLFSEWGANGNVERIESAIPSAITVVLTPAIPAFVVALLLSEEMLRYLFRPEFAVASATMVILMAEKLFQVCHTIFGRALHGLDRPDLAARATIAAVVTNIGLNLSLVPLFGIEGAALATTVSFGLNTVLHVRYLSRFLTVQIDVGAVGWCGLSSATMGLYLFGLTGVIRVDSLVRLCLAIGSGVALYASLLLANRSLRRLFDQHARRILVSNAR